MSAADTVSPAGASVRTYAYQDTQLTITIDDSRDTLLTEFGKATLRDRYLLPGESYQDMFARVACANSDEIVRGEDNGHAQRIYDYISRLWFMPATPVLTNSGVSRGLPISCFLNVIGDSMESIAEGVTENIWLASKGGGIGTCWSPVRSEGELIAPHINGDKCKTSGVVPFLHWQNGQTLAISQGSLRRGSAAAYLNDRHPELPEFIDIRRPSSGEGGDARRKAEDIHHGIMISNAFMEAVLNKERKHDWDLLSPKTGEVIATVNARDLWIKMLVARVETGEPYLVFEDNCNTQLPAIYDALGLKCQQSNLCSEITLHTGPDHLGNWRTAVCCLSSLVWDTADEWMGNTQFIGDVMRFLDNIIEQFIRNSQNYPGFERARYAAERERSVGLGIMGFHSYLQSKEIPFESVKAQRVNDEMWQWLAQIAAKENELMAHERGECPDSADARALNPDLRPARLTHVFSIAPTASISIIAGGSSPCGEPWVANSFTQKTLSGSFEVRNKHLDAQLRKRYWDLRESLELANKTVRFIMKDQPMFAGVLDLSEDAWVEKQWQSVTINNGSVQHLPYLCPAEKGVYRTAFEIDQRWVVRHAADRTPYVCQAQSVNLFLPSNVHKKDLHEVHKLAWESGLKSLYYLRSRAANKAMAVGNLAGEMPNANVEACAVPAGPIYVDEPECLSCQ